MTFGIEHNMVILTKEPIATLSEIVTRFSLGVISYDELWEELEAAFPDTSDNATYSLDEEVHVGI